MSRIFGRRRFHPKTRTILFCSFLSFFSVRSPINRLTIVIDIVEGQRRGGPQNGQNSLWSREISRKQGGSQMAQIQCGVKPDIFKHASVRQDHRMSVLHREGGTPSHKGRGGRCRLQFRGKTDGGGGGEGRARLRRLEEELEVQAVPFPTTSEVQRLQALVAQLQSQLVQAAPATLAAPSNRRRFCPTLRRRDAGVDARATSRSASGCRSRKAPGSFEDLTALDDISSGVAGVDRPIHNNAVHLCERGEVSRSCCVPCQVRLEGVPHR